MPRFAIVEDEPMIAVMLEDWLLELGCDVVGIAGTVAGALKLIKEQAPQAVILDLKLGREDSEPVAHELRAMGIPTIYASGLTPMPMPEGAGTMFLTKPYDFEALRAIVEKLDLK